jgi:hypothetical protein
MSIKASGVEPGQRRLNGPQTTGRDYRSLSKAEFNIKRTNDVAISMRDGMKLLSDLFQPDVDERFPAVLSVSPSPRQIQDFGVPLTGSRRVRYLCPTRLRAALRGTGAEGTRTFMDQQERDVLRDDAAHRSRHATAASQGYFPRRSNRRPLRRHLAQRTTELRIYLVMDASDRNHGGEGPADVAKATAVPDERPACALIAAIGMLQGRRQAAALEGVGCRTRLLRDCTSRAKQAPGSIRPTCR